MHSLATWEWKQASCDNNMCCWREGCHATQQWYWLLSNQILSFWMFTRNILFLRDYKQDNLWELILWNDKILFWWVFLMGLVNGMHESQMKKKICIKFFLLENLILYMYWILGKLAVVHVYASHLAYRKDA